MKPLYMFLLYMVGMQLNAWKCIETSNTVNTERMKILYMFLLYMVVSEDRDPWYASDHLEMQ